MIGRILSVLVLGTNLLVMGCGTEYDAELEQHVGQSAFEMNTGRVTVKQVLDCNEPGMKSCHECGAGEDGVICCGKPPCTVINKPKPAPKPSSASNAMPIVQSVMISE